MKTILNVIVALGLLAGPVLADHHANISGLSGVALSGYDPVAFFTESKPVNGDPGIKATHEGATYFFASKDNRKAFEADPSKYAPQFGGYCAYGTSVGVLFPVDINTWQVHNGKLYFNLNPGVLEVFNKDRDGNIAKAVKKWPGLIK